MIYYIMIWYIMQYNMIRGQEITVDHTSGTLTILKVKSSMEGFYSCIVYTQQQPSVSSVAAYLSVSSKCQHTPVSGYHSKCQHTPVSGYHSKCQHTPANVGIPQQVSAFPSKCQHTSIMCSLQNFSGFTLHPEVWCLREGLLSP